MSLQQKSKELVNEIKRTNEFIELKKAKANVEKYKDLKNEIDMFQKQQQNLLSSNRTKSEVEYLSKKLDSEFKNLSNIPEVRQLIAAGKNFDNMIFRLYNNINNSLDIEMRSR